MPNRLKEAIKQVQIVKEEIDDTEVTQDLEQALKSLEDAVERLENDG
ncbi:hypothetical protein GCM10009006_38000 [Haloarcula argentinensis]|uniref:Uncharacterized protein n=1 Tax=Haloarcula argentinensis TaxID=43776 RepID=A0A830FJJ9_HALAR|nr:hypothetical protein GCM10009006_38000 [Haloarcula argentinensis]